MKQRIKQRTSCLVLAIGFIAALALSSCSKEGDIADSNPGSEIRLTSGVQVQSRAAGTAPDTQIADGEPVAVYVDEAASPATQLYGNNVLTADGNGGLSDGTPMYFPASGNKVDIYAFHTNATLAEAFPTSIEHSVAADQKRGYPPSDLLYAARTGVKRSTSAVDLTFYHLLAKVAVVLKPGTGMTAADLDGAEVTIESTRLKATFTPDKTKDVAVQSNRAAMVATLTTGSGNPVAAITIPTATTADFSSVAGYGEGIIVPQTVNKDQPFIRVKLANGTTLSYRLDANTTFASGKKHTYQITVNFKELTATATIGDWDKVAAVDDVATMPEPPIGNKTPAEAAVGDFYMNDGTLVGKDENLTDVQQAACIGIVYSTDASRIGATATQALKAKGVTPHGLVMALTNASEGCMWGEYGKDENSGGSTGEPFNGNTDQLQKQYSNIDGYGETHWIIDTYKNSGTTLQDIYSAFYHASRYGTADSNTDKYATPSNTTGWFIPSMGQWWDILSNMGGIDLSSYRNKTDSYTSISGAAPTAVNNMNKYLEKIDGATTFYTGTYFWSSSECNGYNACYVRFDSSGYLHLGDAYKNYSRNWVRCSFAF